MAGRFMDKETVEAEANRLGVNLEGLTWPQKQGAVMAAQREEREAENLVTKKKTKESKEEVRDLTESEIRTIIFNKDVDDPFVPIIDPSKEIYVHIENPEDPMEEMRGKTVMIAPEMAQTTRQLFGYDEVLDDDVQVEEVIQGLDINNNARGEQTDGTLRIIGKTGKKVIARTALPKEGAGITFRPDKDRVPVVTFQGRSGYLWTHHRLPNIKQLLLESGYYEDYRNRFQDEPFVWHAAGKLLVCDIQLAESVLRDIERKAREERVRVKQNDAFIRSQLGE